MSEIKRLRDQNLRSLLIIQPVSHRTNLSPSPRGAILAVFNIHAELLQLVADLVR
jgi:hypothetical protein